jgi:hypothetical protein
MQLCQVCCIHNHFQYIQFSSKTVNVFVLLVHLVLTSLTIYVSDCCYGNMAMTSLSTNDTSIWRHVTLDGKLNTLKVLRGRPGLVNCHCRCERDRTCLLLLQRSCCVRRNKDNNGKQQSNKIRFRCWGSEEGKVLLSSEGTLCVGA